MSIVSTPNRDQINTTLDKNFQNVIRWSTPVAVTSAGLGTAVTMTHDLNAIPNVIHVEPYIDSRWWADQDDRKIWTTTIVTLHTSHAGLFIVRAGVQ